VKKLFVICLGLLMAGAAMAKIEGSKHDFSADTWSGGKICIACHTPHNAKTAVANSPLWNHTLTTATFTVYDDLGTSTTFDATAAQPDGVSKLCLSCHDGTVALEAFGTATTGSEYLTSTDSAFLDTDLTNDHPVSFVYNSALATTDGELFDPSVATTSLGGTIADDLLSGGSTMECSSCHDVHNANNNGKLLVMSNAGSALCLTCHDK
jgi:predicted CXXCH cytochrome family protein